MWRIVVLKTVFNHLKPQLFVLLILVLIISSISCITIKLKPSSGQETSPGEVKTQPEQTVEPGPMPYAFANSKLSLGPVFDGWLKGKGYSFLDMANHEVPITWSGLNFTGRYEAKPLAGMGNGTLVTEISGTLSAVPVPQKPVNLTLSYKSSWDVTNPNWHDFGSYSYTLTNFQVGVVAMSNKEGQWMLNSWTADNKGAALQKYLSNLVVKWNEIYVGPPNQMPANRADQSWTYTDPACSNTTSQYPNPTELNINIRCP
jgi:hypothetical protein